MDVWKSAKTIVLTLWAASAVAGTAWAEPAGCKLIDSLPAEVKKAGTYCLSKNFKVKLAAGNAITVTGDNVLIDLSEHTIWNKTGGNTAYGIYALQRSNVVVRNGTLVGFDRAVFLQDYLPHETAVGNLVENVRANDNTSGGIDVYGPGATVRGSQVLRTGATGIGVAGAGARVIDCDVLSVEPALGAAVGISVKYADGGLVRDNRVQNVSSGNAQDTHGILIENSDGVMVRGNDLSNTGTYGIRYFSADGIYLDNQVFGATNAFFGAGTAAGDTNYED